MILHKKYAAKRISLMTPEEISLWAKSLLLKIHVITGWTIPTDDLLIVLVDQFEKKLVESYGDMNHEEIEYAFRQYGTSIKDWGKNMNLALMDQVFVEYLSERKRISHELEERNAPVPEQKILSDEELLNIHRGDVEAFYQRLRKGMIPKFIPNYFYNVLEKDGLIDTGTTVDQFFTKRLNQGSPMIYKLEKKSK